MGTWRCREGEIDDDESMAAAATQCSLGAESAELGALAAQMVQAMSLIELEPIGRLVLAAVLGFVIGLEREAAGQSAGERTHALVALGSATFALLSLTAFPGADSARVAAGVVSGLGFLGAGTILRDADNRIRGLTTAAGLWGVGAIGLAIGSGMYLIGVACAIIAALILVSERVLRLGEKLRLRRPTKKDSANDE